MDFSQNRVTGAVRDGHRGHQVGATSPKHENHPNLRESLDQEDHLNPLANGPEFETLTDDLDSLSLLQGKPAKHRAVPRRYRPSYTTLRSYRALSIPFINVDDQNRVFTANASSWKEKRLFTEMLQEAGADEQTALDTQLVKEQPQPIISMLQDGQLEDTNP